MRIRWLLIVIVLLTSWLAMQAVHELGHVLAAWATHSTVDRIMLHPLALSQTLIGDNRAPLLIAWSGPLVGTTVPLLMWSLLVACRNRFAFLLRFFAGFCLVANGAYLGVGAVARIGDPNDILSHGSPPWLLFLFAAVAIPPGLLLWHRQSPHFLHPVHPRSSLLRVTLTLAALLILGFSL